MPDEQNHRRRWSQRNRPGLTRDSPSCAPPTAHVSRHRCDSLPSEWLGPPTNVATIAEDNLEDSMSEPAGLPSASRPAMR